MAHFIKTQHGLNARELPSISPEHDGEFMRLTTLGLAASSANDRETAARHFERAREVAETVFDDALRQRGLATLVAPMILNVSCQNTASERCLRGDKEGAIEDLAHAIRRLMTAADAIDAPLDMRLNCVRHLRHALLAFAALQELDEGMLDIIAKTVSRVVSAAKANQSCFSAARSKTRH